LGGFFFISKSFFVLAPGRKPTKIQTQMAASLEELSTKFDDMAKQMHAFTDMTKQFAGLREMMRQTLDSVNGMGHRQTSAETMLDDLRDQSEAMTTSICDAATRLDNLVRRVDSLEAPRAAVTTGRGETTDAPRPAVTIGPSPGPGVLGGVPTTSVTAPSLTRALDLNSAPETSPRHLWRTWSGP
jgi:hypothetical protein